MYITVISLPIFATTYCAALDGNTLFICSHFYLLQMETNLVCGVSPLPSNRQIPSRCKLVGCPNVHYCYTAAYTLNELCAGLQSAIYNCLVEVWGS